MRRFFHFCLGLSGALALAAFVIEFVRRRQKTGGFYRPGSNTHPLPRAAVVSAKSHRATLGPGFSEPLFLDFVQLLFTRAHEARASGSADPLRPYFGPKALQRFLRTRPGVGSVSVAFGSVAIEDSLRRGGFQHVSVRIQASLVEGREEESTDWFTEDVWHFERLRKAGEKAPDELLALGCPNCGSPVELRRDGSCEHCDEVVTNARFGWRVNRVEGQDERLDAEELFQGGAEVGTDLPTIFHERKHMELQALQRRDPSFEPRAFREFCRQVFLHLQASWTAGRWALARPFLSDALFQTHRHWIERYAQEGVENHLEQVEVGQVELCDVFRDAYHETITVRVHASCLDWTVDRHGRVLHGSQTEPRAFTEYWTFTRRAGVQAPGSLVSCPRCGAPLQVNAAGICEHCDAHLSSGKFGWVLARITQDEAYHQARAESAQQRVLERREAGAEELRATAWAAAALAAWIPFVAPFFMALAALRAAAFKREPTSGWKAWRLGSGLALMAYGAWVLWVYV